MRMGVLRCIHFYGSVLIWERAVPMISRVGSMRMADGLAFIVAIGAEYLDTDVRAIGIGNNHFTFHIADGMPCIDMSYRSFDPGIDRHGTNRMGPINKHQFAFPGNPGLMGNPLFLFPVAMFRFSSSIYVDSP